MLIHQYVNLEQYINDKIVDYRSIIDISYHSENLQHNGSIQYSLENGWTSNNAYFNNLVGDITIEYQGSDYSYSWHSYTATLIISNTNIYNFCMSKICRYRKY